MTLKKAAASVGVAILASLIAAPAFASQNYSLKTYNGMDLQVPCTITYNSDSNHKAVDKAVAQVESVTGFDFQRSAGEADIQYKFVTVIDNNPKIAGLYSGSILVYPDHAAWNGGTIQINTSIKKSWQKTALLHETAHLFGLDHIDNTGEAMNPFVTDLKQYGPGDIAGLQQAAAVSGCLTSN